MVAETLTRSPLILAPTGGLAGELKRQYFAYELTVAVEDGDIFRVGWLPKNCLVTGGQLAADLIDTDGTPELDMDIGWEANGGASATWVDPNTGLTLTNSASTASATGFANLGVLSGVGLAQVFQAGIDYRVFVYPVPLFLSEPTMVVVEANAPAVAGHEGTFGFYLDYIML